MLWWDSTAQDEGGDAVSKNSSPLGAKLARFVHDNTVEGVRVVVGLQNGQMITGTIDHELPADQLHLVDVAALRPQIGRTIAYRFPVSAISENGRQLIGVDTTLERFRLTDYVILIGREVPARRWLEVLKVQSGGHWPDKLAEDVLDDDPDEFVYVLDAYVEEMAHPYQGDDKLDVDFDDINCCGDRH
jgi:hypothetical protein